MRRCCNFANQISNVAVEINICPIYTHEVFSFKVAEVFAEGPAICIHSLPNFILILTLMEESGLEDITRRFLPVGVGLL